MTRALSIALLLAWTPLASAQSGSRVRGLVEDGEFEQAASAYAEAMASASLTRDELVALLEARALLAHSERDEPALDRALSALASIAPTHRFDRTFPPELAARSVEVGRRMRGRLSVETQIVPSAVGVRLTTRVDHDPGELVRAVRVRVFDASSGQWEDASEGPLEAAPGRTQLAYVEAIGPGGVVLARRGSPDEPITIEGPRVDLPEAPPALPPARAASGPPDWVWVLVAVGVGLLVAGGIGAGIYYATNPTIDTQPRPPMIVTDG